MNKSPSFSPSCKHCYDTGWFGAIHRENGCHYTFRCGWCMAAKNAGYSEKIPVWSSPFIKNFESLKEFNAREGWKKEKTKTEEKEAV